MTYYMLNNRASGRKTRTSTGNNYNKWILWLFYPFICWANDCVSSGSLFVCMSAFVRGLNSNDAKMIVIMSQRFVKLQCMQSVWLRTKQHGPTIQAIPHEFISSMKVTLFRHKPTSLYASKITSGLKTKRTHCKDTKENKMLHVSSTWMNTIERVSNRRIGKFSWEYRNWLQYICMVTLCLIVFVLVQSWLVCMFVCVYMCMFVC